MTAIGTAITSSFPYSPLNESTHEIRLLKLCHKSDFDPGKPKFWTLNHASLDDTPPYVALSYAWGDPTAVSSVLINDEAVWVAKNLHEALENLSRLPDSPYIWADAICINQDDHVEKASQVSLMDRIYSQSSHIMIWLGPPADSVTEALILLSDLGWEFFALRQGLPEEESIDFRSGTNFHALASRFSEEINDEGWRKIRELFQRPWWRRVWVIQEAVLAKDASVLCGNLAVGFCNVLEAIQFFSLVILWPSGELGPQSSEISSSVGHFNLLHKQYIESLKRSAPGLTLEELLLSTWFVSPGSIEATDSRDRIYGLLALLTAAERELIMVDYSEQSTLAKICLNITCALIGRHGPYIMAFTRQTALHQQGLPSWGIDWTQGNSGETARVMVGRLTFRRDDGPYNASGGADWSPRCIQVPFRDPRLTIKAVKLGEVKEFVAALPLPVTIDAFREWILEVETRMAMIATGKQVQSEQERLGATIWRLPTAGTFRRQWIRPTYEENFALLEGFKVLMGVTPIPESVGQGQMEFAEWFQREVDLYAKSIELAGCQAFVTSEGYPGLGPKDVKEGDLVAIFLGGPSVFILREHHNGLYQVIGTCYILGMMDGEAIHGNIPFEEITLI